MIVSKVKVSFIADVAPKLHILLWVLAQSTALTSFFFFFSRVLFICMNNVFNEQYKISGKCHHC